MILPLDTLTAPCFARQSGLRVELKTCEASCARPCARARRSIGALLAAIGLPAVRTDLPPARDTFAGPSGRTGGVR